MSWVSSPLYESQKANGKLSPDQVAKLEQAIDVHGYRGASKKRHNGIVALPKRDKKLWQFLRANQDQVPPEFQHSFPVKVVAHVPTGDRLVGLMNMETQRLFVVGTESYT
jgi:hypothetical protein